MLFIGITGGVGAGKTEILNHIKEKWCSRIMLADEIAHDVMAPNGRCYGQLKGLFGDDDVWQADGSFDRKKLAAVLFSDDTKREKEDAIVHPAVKEVVREEYAREKELARVDLLVLEAALLIEEKYDEICGELWYIYNSEENRRERLKASRGYSDAKVDSIFKSQLSEETFRAHCAEVIDNNGTREDTFRQVDALMEKKGIRPR